MQEIGVMTIQDCRLPFSAPLRLNSPGKEKKEQRQEAGGPDEQEARGSGLKQGSCNNLSPAAETELLLLFPLTRPLTLTYPPL